MRGVTWKPNFFIVGAPRCGTTSLHRYCSQHPEILMSNTKEPCFLAPDFWSPYYPQTEEEYLSCFQGYKGQKMVGESTSFYLFSDSAAQRIHEFSPKAKIIAMLRDPVDRVVSMHARRLKLGSENIARIEDALDAESDRMKGKRIPSGFTYPRKYYLYREFGNYVKQLERYFHEFGRENVHVIIFDDFRRDTEGEFVKVCDFLGVSAAFKPDFSIHESAQTPRFVMFYRAFFRIRQATIRSLKPIMPSPLRKLLLHLYNVAKEMNMKNGRVPISTETRVALTLYYDQEIRDLEKLLSKDLSCWRL